MPQPRQQTQPRPAQQGPANPEPSQAAQNGPTQDAASVTTEGTAVNSGQAGDLTVFGQGLLSQGHALQSEKEALFGRIEANRSMLRNLAKTDSLSAEQVEAMNKLYPPREPRKAKNTDNKDENSDQNTDNKDENSDQNTDNKDENKDENNDQK